MSNKKKPVRTDEKEQRQAYLECVEEGKGCYDNVVSILASTKETLSVLLNLYKDNVNKFNLVDNNVEEVLANSIDQLNVSVEATSEFKDIALNPPEFVIDRTKKLKEWEFEIMQHALSLSWIDEVVPQIANVISFVIETDEDELVKLAKEAKEKKAADEAEKAKAEEESKEESE